MSDVRGKGSCSNNGSPGRGGRLCDFWHLAVIAFLSTLVACGPNDRTGQPSKSIEDAEPAAAEVIDPDLSNEERPGDLVRNDDGEPEPVDSQGGGLPAALADGATCPEATGGWSDCSVECPCSAAKGDCDSDDECANGTRCMRNIGERYGWDPGVDVCLAPCSQLAVGSTNYCSADCLCQSGQGDCDSDRDCADSGRCVADIGAEFGFAPTVDVCIDVCDERFAGSSDYCSAACQCDIGQGDCDVDAHCVSGSVCGEDVGGHFGYAATVDVCVAICDETFVGTRNYCSEQCQCEPGQGDCDSDSDCAPGARCAADVGADFGFAVDLDVCVDQCDPRLAGTWDYCSSVCPCSDGQGDCDSDDDCVAGAICVKGAGPEYGYAEGMDVCQAVEVTFAGQVVDELGRALSGVSVRLNGENSQISAFTDDDGRFSLRIAPGQRYVINAEKNRHVPFSLVHSGEPLTDMQIVLAPVDVVAIDPSEPVEVQDSHGSRLTLAANALVDANGDRPTGPVAVHVHSYDPSHESMIGGTMEAIDSSGQAVALESIGAISVEFVDAAGNHYQLAPGQSAQISVPVPAGLDYTGPVPMWYYDSEQGRWIEEGVGAVEDGVATGTVSHFTVWNFDFKVAWPACIKVRVGPNLAGPGQIVDARVVVRSNPPRTHNHHFTGGTNNAIVNIPPDTEVAFYMPPSATEPMDVVNSGDSWGGTGWPPPPYDQCKSTVTLNDPVPGHLGGYALVAGGQEQGGHTVLLKDGATVVAEAASDEVGSYSLSAPAGIYDLNIGKPGHLRFVAQAVEIKGARTVLQSCVQLVGGDVNADDTIDASDSAAVQDRLNTSASPGDPVDINGDGQVTNADLAIVLSNVGKSGPLDQDTAQCPGVAVSDVVTGETHTCAVLATGDVRCWGGNSTGQLGYGHINSIGDDEPAAFAGPISLAGPVVQAAAGGHHTCAVLTGGSVSCWGYNEYGQLGYGHTNWIGDNELPSSAGPVSLGGTVVALAAGAYHTCALLDSGDVRCWGLNQSGQLGYGHINSIGDNELPSSAGPVSLGGTVVALAAGEYHTCALLDSAQVRCWGYNLYGQLGYGHTNSIGNNELPSSTGPVSLGGTVVALAAGAYHTCALLDSAEVRCWGLNESGQLGYGHINWIGDNELPSSAGPVSLSNPVISLDAGEAHSCALQDTAELYCWGYNWYGQLGYGHQNWIGDNELPSSAGPVPLF
ncbi:MAG: carboxypeptidase regulatory-like domain-containing protein [Proteobacteria bacterium]|nr:carboxypeptidase regulatory-like domain-containing protein [Pseudomonadota bacterium]